MDIGVRFRNVKGGKCSSFAVCILFHSNPLPLIILVASGKFVISFTDRKKSHITSTPRLNHLSYWDVVERNSLDLNVPIKVFVYRCHILGTFRQHVQCQLDPLIISVYVSFELCFGLETYRLNQTLKARQSRITLVSYLCNLDYFSCKEASILRYFFFK